MKIFLILTSFIFLVSCTKHSEEIRYTYCPDPVLIPDCVKFGDIESVCFQKWIEKQGEVNKKLSEGQKWRWKGMEKQ